MEQLIANEIAPVPPRQTKRPAPEDVIELSSDSDHDELGEEEQKLRARLAEIEKERAKKKRKVKREPLVKEEDVKPSI